MKPSPLATVAPPSPTVTAVERFLARNAEPTTPFLVMDLDIVARQYACLRAALPDTAVFYAVKANPAPQVLELLIAEGCCFDVASPGEVELCLRLGADPARLSYGNTVKKERDVAAAHRQGVRIFTVDSEPELDKIVRSVRAAEGTHRADAATVFVRLSTDGAGADWPLTRKFGCSPAEAGPILRQAARAGLQVGISFHVGSQQRNPHAWDAPLAQVASLADALAADGHELAGVNLGGGLPSRHLEPTPDIQAYGTAIRAAIATHLGPGFRGTTMVEPGRFLVGDAGVIRAEVVQIVRRAGDPHTRWVFLDIGLFNGLTETLDEAIRYRLRCPGDPRRTGPVILAGPSCDSADVLYENHRYELPLDLAVGHQIDILGTGAYTCSYASVGFNGFPPLRDFYVQPDPVQGSTTALV